ncbi:alpha-galactosidase [uncultured Ruminococcus sp.]|uniref:alpha-galactosidase n=1 Tax=uncultured Ruminococcus sp. TaxID=165186 RepID=UPI00292F9314|nr:alpha-galactosidase [uncultured Ruminococcus sp.]
MSIRYIEETGQLILETRSTSYQMKIDSLGYLNHLYYGPKVETTDMSYPYRIYDHGFSGNPYDMRNNRAFSLDSMPQEYTSFGVGDFRVSSIAASCSDGSRCAEFRYEKHEIIDGKYSIPGLPSVYDSGAVAQTLIVTLIDNAANIRIKLYYGVFESLDIITRAAEISNAGYEIVWLRKASSMCLELPFGKWDMIHFHGRHCMERQPERVPLFHGIHTLSSGRGMSSHQHNPFVILCDHEATEDSGTCYGMMLMYSGNHKTEIELDQFDSTRVVMGLSDDRFRWELAPNTSLHTPEVILTCADGLTELSHRYHRVIRNNVVRGAYKLSHRPVLINNWEAMYFDLNEEKLLALADKAASLGIELFVLDDGWFKNRVDDNAALGDWVPDEKKLPNGLDSLIEKINAKGMKFGLWVEPEMVSEDSDLYRAHPDWALTAPNRAPMMARNQLVLDLSRQEVHEYIFNTLSDLLSKYNITYIKWDFNRPLSDVYSRSTPSPRQGEVAHRYYLSLYKIYERLTEKFPNVLFEGCAGGGGRFDAGMLHYAPQIWCSDNTDPISRLTIQYGTSFGYPMSSVGAHVSATPNHQTGRLTPLSTRGIVAMSGAFGYELDLLKLSDGELAEIKEQVARFKEIEPIVHNGLFYRLSSMQESGHYFAWQFVSPEKDRSLVNIVVTNPLANSTPIHVRLKGLDPDALYSVDGEFECSGSALMKAGYTFTRLTGDYPALQVDIKQVK